ncbi:hypothetical protein HII31_02296, partial [Pseudocercospora fuligena]
ASQTSGVCPYTPLLSPSGQRISGKRLPFFARLQVLPTSTTKHYQRGPTYKIWPTSVRNIDHVTIMSFSKFSNRRKSTQSSSSASSSSSSLDETLMTTTLPLAPREDDYNMSEETRRQRLLAKCKRSNIEPWKSAKPISNRE